MRRRLGGPIQGVTHAQVLAVLMIADMAAKPRIGPYRLLETLGHGGMGVVYRAEHTGTGELCALKTVRLAREELLQSLRREILALRRIRHPGIVRILDQGVEDGLPWYAMEWIRGVSLREQLRPAPHDERTVADDGTTRGIPIERTEQTEQTPTAEQPQTPPQVRTPEQLRSALTLVRRLCAPLAYLHGEGFVHRDLKPENVCVRPDGMPVLVDFGLLTQFGGETSREAIYATASSVGTLSYIAPEQIRGELVDARADLYALGCILYELITGRPPFHGASPYAVVHAHLQDEPVRPSRIAGPLPTGLDSLVLRLLAKSPADRVGHADDVAARLAELGAENGWTEQAPSPRAYLYRPGLAGREAALHECESDLTRLRAGQGGLVLVAGESGVGKTRFALEFARRASAAGLRVLTGECLPASSSDATGSSAAGRPLEPFRPMLQAIADLCRSSGREETERLLGPRGRLLSAFEPALADAPGQDAHPEPADLPPDVARFRLFSFLSETVRAFVHGAPTLLLLDDLQWADELTLGFFEHLLQSRALESSPLLLLGTYRAEEVTAALERLADSASVRTVALGRLGAQAVDAIVGDMLAVSPPPEQLSRSLHEQSEGNPFFVAEYLRAAVEEGMLRRDARGSWRLADGTQFRGPSDPTQLALPGSLRELVDRRLAGLPDASQEVASAASVLGRESATELLSRLTKLDETVLLDAVTVLLRRHVLFEIEPGRFAFAHDKIREQAYAGVAQDRRGALHGAAAEALEELFPDRREEWAAALGRHWEEAGEPVRARGHYLVGARRALSSYAYGDAERLYRSHLALADTGSADGAGVRAELAKSVLAFHGRNHDAIEELRQALQVARALEDARLEATILLGLSAICCTTGDIEESLATSERALALHRARGDRSGEGEALEGVGNALHESGRTDEAEAHYEQALAIYQEVGWTKNEGTTLTNLASIAFTRGNLAVAEAKYQAAIELYRRTGNRFDQTVSLNNIACIRMQEGKLAEAEQLFQAVAASIREIGERRLEATTWVNLAQLWSLQGRPEESERLLEKSLHLLREVGNRPIEAMVLHKLGSLSRNRGEVERARAQMEEALRIFREVGNRAGLPYLLGGLAILTRQVDGDFDKAEVLLEEADAVFTEINDLVGRVVITCERGHLALARGESGAAYLKAAEGMVNEARISTAGEMGRSMARLRGAQAEFDAHQPLFRGDRLEDLPEPLRRRVAGETPEK